jgi:nucleotidyltransferase/DNA polymerase involved in DNA repair
MKPDRTIVHVDMDAFYASIEQMDHPAWKGKPVVVGADPVRGKGRGVVSAASYEARKFGIHSALPISTAYRLCPKAVFVRPRFKRYTELSKKVIQILGEFSPLVEQISIDEAFLDCTGTEKLFGSSLELAQHIKGRILRETGLRASVGIASNKSIAKIASDLHKPDGLCICQPGGEKEFMASLPLKYLWGAGRKTIDKLDSLGFKEVRDIQRSSPEKLERILGKYGIKLWELANGQDRRPVVLSMQRKSISEEITFREDIEQDSYIEQVLFQIAENLTRKMRREGIMGRTVTLKIRLQPFQTYTRSHSMEDPINDTNTVRYTAQKLYRGFNRMGKKVRLIGIAVSNLIVIEIKSTGQLELFSGAQKGEKKRSDTDRVLDQMKRKYGDKVTRAAFLPPK